jgi:L-ascorbate oxidase
LIVHDLNDQLENERVLILSDWYSKRNASNLLEGILAAPFKWVGDADSIVTNGKAPCQGEECVGEPDYTVISVEEGQDYRLRIINSASLGYFTFKIAGHALTIIEIDSYPCVPYTVDNLEINSGQRYSVLISADQNPKDYVIDTQGSINSLTIPVRWRKTGPSNGQAVLRYEGSNSPIELVPLIHPNSTSGWIIDNLASNLSSSQFPGDKFIPSNNTIVLKSEMIKLPTGEIKWTMNNISFVIPEDRPLMYHFMQSSLDTIPIESAPIQIELGEVVDIVLQNTAALNGVCGIYTPLTKRDASDAHALCQYVHSRKWTWSIRC